MVVLTKNTKNSHFLSPISKVSKKFAKTRFGSPIERIPNHVMTRRARRSPGRRRSPTPNSKNLVRHGRLQQNKLFDDSDQRIYNFGTEESYFSPQLPVQPMRVILVGHPPEHMLQNKRVQRLLENVCNIEEQISPNSNLDAALKSVALATDDSASFYYPYIYSYSRKERPTSAFSEPQVRYLLNDLVLKLPVSPHLEQIATSDFDLRQGNSLSSMIPLQGHCLSQCSSKGSSRNIGVQTFNYINTAASPISSITQAGRYANGFSTEWVGGVRALRDLHVKLVLRQLRHIDKLNRALDNASQSESGSLFLRQKRKTKLF